MKGQYLGGKPIDVSYSFKKEGGALGAADKHGSVAERVLAYASVQQKIGATAQPQSKTVHF